MPKPAEMTKTAYNTIKHLQFYGGNIAVDNDGYGMCWGTLLKDDDIKWHRRTLTWNTFDQMRPFVSLVDSDPLTGECYELNHQGMNLE